MELLYTPFHARRHILESWRNLNSKFRSFWIPEGVRETKKRSQLHVEAIKFDFLGRIFFIFLVHTTFQKKWYGVLLGLQKF